MASITDIAGANTQDKADAQAFRELKTRKSLQDAYDGGGLARQAEVDQHIMDKVNMLQTFGEMSGGGRDSMVTLRDELGAGPSYDWLVEIPQGRTSGVNEGLAAAMAFDEAQYNAQKGL